MSSARTARLVEDAYINNDISAARDAINDYYTCHCLHPIKQEIYDSHIGTKRTILVGCGRCIHCMETKINEWCTRMYAHAEDFKHVYFVTLTYRSITNPNLPANNLLLQKLSQAIWHKDAYNQTHHMSYNPCLLVKSHYQNFIKRLRKNTGLKDITYVLSGEYGTKYGRPHFHMVLFTNGTLAKYDIARAWSVCLWRSNSGIWSYRKNQKFNGTAYDFPIGRVDFNDLVTNGTFNTTAKVKVDGTYMNASNCFSYVCKYVVKRDKPNLDRVLLAYRNLFYSEKFLDLFNNEVSYKIAHQWLLDHGYSSINADTLYNNQLKQLSYEKTIFKPSQNVFEHGILREVIIDRQTFFERKTLLPEVYYEFKRTFSPFCEFSRGCPIGSVYASRNIQEFTQGVFSKPILQSSGFVVPNYFRTKAKNYLYRFREVHTTLKGSSLALGCLVDLQRRIDEYNENGSLPFRTSTSVHLKLSWSQNLYFAPRLFADAYTGEKITFTQYTANYWRYSRADRKYLNTRSVPLSDFIRSLSISLMEEFERAKVQRNMSRDNMRLRERALLLLTDMGDEESCVSQRFETLQRSYFDEQNKLYHSSHNSAE